MVKYQLIENEKSLALQNLGIYTIAVQSNSPHNKIEIRKIFRKNSIQIRDIKKVNLPIKSKKRNGVKGTKIKKSIRPTKYLLKISSGEINQEILDKFSSNESTTSEIK